MRAAVETTAGREDDARQSLEKAVLSFPGDPQTWYRLAAFQLGTLDAPEQALETIDAVLYLDPHSAPPRALFLSARARLREKTGQAQPGRVAASARRAGEQRSGAALERHDVEAELVEQPAQRARG